MHFHLPKLGLDEIARDHGVEPPCSYRFAICEHDIVLAQLTQYVFPFIGSRDWTSSLALDQFSLIVGAHVLKTYAGLPPLGATKRGGLAPWQGKRATEMMTQSSTGTSISRIWRVNVGYPWSHFTRAFRSTYGLSPYRWLLERRIDRAKALLVSSDFQIADIAIRSGFSDQAAFTLVRLAGSSARVLLMEARRSFKS